jgi:3-phosphoglycerate kinase
VKDSRQVKLSICSAIVRVQVCLLENVRFHAGEVGNCPGFAQQLASLADVFVNDAFAVCHRHQASVTVSVNPAGRVVPPPSPQPRASS